MSSSNTATKGRTALPARPARPPRTSRVSNNPAATAIATVYGPELPPLMAQAGIETKTVSFSTDKVDYTYRIHSASSSSRSQCIERTESELQQLFHSRLVEIMAKNGYRSNEFSEKDVARVMVSNGLMDSVDDDPVLALTSKLRAEMSKIVHKNMRFRMNPDEEEDKDDDDDDDDDDDEDGFFIDPTTLAEHSHPEMLSFSDISNIIDNLDLTSSKEEKKHRPVRKPKRSARGKEEEAGGDSNGDQLPTSADASMFDNAEFSTARHGRLPVAERYIRSYLDKNSFIATKHPHKPTPTSVVDQPASAAAAAAASPAATANPLWNSDAAEEQKQVRAFWLSLTEIEQQALILVEKEVVLARVREHPNFSCNCNVCSRKREAIEHELDFLYDFYYQELQKNVKREKMRRAVRESEKRARATLLTSAGKIADSVVSKLVSDPKPNAAENVKRTLMECMSKGSSPSIPAQLVLDKLLMTKRQLKQKKYGMTGNGKKSAMANDTISSEDLADIEQAAAAIKEWVDSAFEYQREFGGGLSRGGYDSDQGSNDIDEEGEDEEDEFGISNNDLFYTNSMLQTIDTFPADSKKFFDMMERLAEHRMRQEDSLLEGTEDPDGAGGDEGWVNRPSSSHHQIHRRCPDCHGEISDSEEHHMVADAQVPFPNSGFPMGSGTPKNHPFLKRPLTKREQYALNQLRAYSTNEEDSDYLYDDDEEEEDEDEEEEEEEDYEDDTDDDLESDTSEREAEEGRKIFQLFAARLFEQRVVTAYREKVSRERQQTLINELEEEEKRMEAKEKRKQKKKMREKEKKRQIQQQKEEERLARENQKRAEKEQKKATQKRQQRRGGGRQKQKSGNGAGAGAGDVEDGSKTQQRAIEERNRKILEQADKRLAEERVERQRVEEEKKLKREAAAKQKKKQEEKEKEEQKEQTKPDPPVLMVAPQTQTQQQQQQQIPIHVPSPQFKASRPSLPMIHQLEISTAGVSSAGSSRVRANSGSSINYLSPLPPPPPPPVPQAPTSMVVPQPSLPTTASTAVPTDFDDEISSIVGRVMGSCSLHDVLTDGAEWRAEPVATTPNLLSTAPVQPPPPPPPPPPTQRRNSLPSSNSFGAIESIYSAYCALEKFSNDNQYHRPAVRGRGYGVGEISQMHGKLSESEIWNMCFGYMQENPGKCQLDFNQRTVWLNTNDTSPPPPHPPASSASLFYGYQSQSQPPQMYGMVGFGASNPSNGNDRSRSAGNMVTPPFGSFNQYQL